MNKSPLRHLMWTVPTWAKKGDYSLISEIVPLFGRFVIEEIKKENGAMLFVGKLEPVSDVGFQVTKTGQSLEDVKGLCEKYLWDKIKPLVERGFLDVPVLHAVEVDAEVFSRMSGIQAANHIKSIICGLVPSVAISIKWGGGIKITPKEGGESEIIP